MNTKLTIGWNEGDEYPYQIYKNDDVIATAKTEEEAETILKNFTKVSDWTLRKLGLEYEEGSQFYVVERPPRELEYQYHKFWVGDVVIDGNDLIFVYFANLTDRTIRFPADTVDMEKTVLEYLNNLSNIEFYTDCEFINEL